MDRDTDAPTWDVDRVLSAIADVEERAKRAERMLSQRIDRLEKRGGGSLGELDDLGSHVAAFARALLIGYGIAIALRALSLWIAQRQQQQQGS